MDSGIMVSDSVQASVLRVSTMVKSSPASIRLLSSSTVIRSSSPIARSPFGMVDAQFGQHEIAGTLAKGLLHRHRLRFRHGRRKYIRLWFRANRRNDIGIRSRLRFRIRLRPRLRARNPRWTCSASSNKWHIQLHAFAYCIQPTFPRFSTPLESCIQPGDVIPNC